jgi:hypothetical protein
LVEVEKWSTQFFDIVENQNWEFHQERNNDIIYRKNGIFLIYTTPYEDTTKGSDAFGTFSSWIVFTINLNEWYRDY